MTAATANVQCTRVRFETEYVQYGLANGLEHCLHQRVISNPITTGVTIPEFDLAFILHDFYFA
jgi:hypothetical protein